MTQYSTATPVKVLRAGMIGLDTSHVPAFAEIFNSPAASGDLAGIKIVAGFPGGTDIPFSRDRIAGFAGQLRGLGAAIVDSIDCLLEMVDVVLIESVDGRIHLSQAIPVIQAGKPLWIDKPIAGSLADAMVIFEVAKRHGVPVFSSSAHRFAPELEALLSDQVAGAALGAATWGTCTYLEGTPDLFFYGIHGIEPLFKIMGMGCETVSRVHTPSVDMVTGVWNDGRIGTYRGLRQGAVAFGATIYGSRQIVQADKLGTYEDLCRAIGRFFKTGRSPVAPEETLEVFALMEAAEESKRRGAAVIPLADVQARARTEAAAVLARFT